jgi:hypothetical protein
MHDFAVSTGRAGGSTHGWRPGPILSRASALSFRIVSTSRIAMIFAWNGTFWSLNLTATNAAPLTAFIASFSGP